MESHVQTTISISSAISFQPNFAGLLKLPHHTEIYHVPMVFQGESLLSGKNFRAVIGWKVPLGLANSSLAAWFHPAKRQVFYLVHDAVRETQFERYFLFWSRRMHLHLKSPETSSNHSSLYQRCRCCPAEWGMFSFAALMSDILPLLINRKQGRLPDKSSSVCSFIAPLCLR